MDKKTIKVTVWNENLHEKEDVKGAIMKELYPGGLHGTIANILRSEDVEVQTATMDQEECGLTVEVLENTDVLVWWGHAGHHLVPDEIADRVYNCVLEGMGLIVLHSGHYSKVFKKLMGTSCNLRWRHDDRERIWTVKTNHPIAEGVDETFVLECEEMYGEPFIIPEPLETIFMGWFKGGEVMRSGCTWVRGNGKIFFFQPGHETNASFHNKNVQKILQNAVRWACPVKKDKTAPCISGYVHAANPLEQ